MNCKTFKQCLYVMNWFQNSTFATIAKTALKEAQRTIDKALDIKLSEQNNENFPYILATKELESKKSSKITEASKESSCLKEGDCLNKAIYLYNENDTLWSQSMLKCIVHEKKTSSVNYDNAKDVQILMNDLLNFVDNFGSITNLASKSFNSENEILYGKDDVITEIINNLNKKCEDKKPLLKSQLETSFDDDIFDSNNVNISNDLKTYSFIDENPQEVKNNFNKYQQNHILSDKDIIIKELKKEGEKLSKQQFQQQSLIKKLKIKDKENEQIILNLRKHLELSSEEIKKKHSLLKSKQEVESDLLGELDHEKKIIQQQDQNIKQLMKKLSKAEDQIALIQETLDSSRNSDLLAIQQLSSLCEEQNLLFQTKESNLIKQIESLQGSQLQLQISNASRENSLQQKIADLQEQLQKLKISDDVLKRSITNATEPLMCQIESLQASFIMQKKNFEETKKKLQNQLYAEKKKKESIQNQLDLCQKKVIDLNVEVERLELLLVKEQEQKKNLLHKLKENRDKKIQFEMENNGTSIEYHQNEISPAILISRQVKKSTEADFVFQKNVTGLRGEYLDKEVQTVSNSDINANSYVCNNIIESQNFEDWENDILNSKMKNGLPFFGSALLESLLQQMKRKQGKIMQLQKEVEDLKSSKEYLTSEIIELSEKNCQYTDIISSFNNLNIQYTELQKEHSFLLQLYGEKIEESEELKMDLNDFKEMYKLQLEELLKEK